MSVPSASTSAASSDSDRFRDACAQVLQTCRQLADQGFLAGTGGNVALRVDDRHFCVTPSGTDYYTMSPEDICVLTLEERTQISGTLKPSVESGLHALVLQARPDCMASVHTHQPVASAYTLLAQPLNVMSPDHQELLGVRVPCAGYAPSGTSWLAGKVAREVNMDSNAWLMRNHGVVCVGATLDTAVQRVAALEQACAEFFSQHLTQRSSKLPASLVSAVSTTLKRALPDSRAAPGSTE